MTVVDPSRGPVGKWTALMPPDSRDIFDDVVHYVRVLADVAAILEREQLLTPQRVHCADWVHWNEPLKLVRASRPPATLDWGDLPRLEYGEVLFDRARRTVPLEISVDGVGIVYDEHGAAVEVRDTVWISYFYFVQPYLSVQTQTDAWLPRDLDGAEQPAVYEANRDRLARGLAAVQTFLGEPLEPEEDLKFCTADGFYLRNVP